MSTNSTVAVKTEKGYKTIYCHFDGYFSYMYPMLNDYYGTYERAEALVSLGDASSINKRMVPSLDSGHSFDHPEKDVCVFYHRDRGEPWSGVAPAMYSKEEAIHSYYSYVFEDGMWHAYQGGVEVDSYEY